MWTQKADFGGLARFGALGLSIGTFGYIGLGDLGASYSNDFWEYDPTSDTWTQKNTFGGEVRTLSTGFSISNKIFAGTGFDYINGIKYVDFWEYTSACTPPEITSEPGNQSITYGASASYSVAAALGVSYQWQQDAGTGFVDITDGSLFSGATNDTLTIALPTVNMTGYKYRCIVTGDCSLTATSDGNATLTVAPLEIVFTPDASQTKGYGAADPAPFTYMYAPSLLGTDVISGQMGRAPGEDAGDYAFTAGTLTAGGNYKLTVAAEPTFIITPVALTITAADKAKCYDGSVYSEPYTVIYNGFVNTEDASVLGGTLVFGGTSSTGILAGNYSIDPSGLTSVNYIINYVNGTLLIKAAPDAASITRSGDSLLSNVTPGNQWYLDGVEIPGSTGNVVVATANGNYYTVITQVGCSSAPSNTIAIVDVSIKEFGSKVIDIYPNPSNGMFNIKLKTPGKTMYTMEVYNSLGALVWKQDEISINGNNAKTVDLRDLKPGLYTIVLKNSTISSVKKVYITK